MVAPENNSRITQSNIAYHLSQPETQYFLADYQRAYAWGRGNWQKLWENILEVNQSFENNDEPTKIKGLGLLTTSKLLPRESSVEADQDLNSIEKIEVIDGQQRMLTINLLLLALRDSKIFLAKDNKDNKERKDNFSSRFFINPGRSNGDRYRFMPRDNIDKKALHGLINGEKSLLELSKEFPQNDILQGYKYFLNQINDSGLSFESILYAIHQLRLGLDELIEGQDKVDEFVRLNDLGKTLAPSEKIRGVLSRILHKYNSLEDNPVNDIENLLRTTYSGSTPLVRKKLDTIWTNFLSLKKGKLVDINKTQEILEELVKNAYEKGGNPDEGRAKVHQFFTEFKEFATHAMRISESMAAKELAFRRELETLSTLADRTADIFVIQLSISLSKKEITVDQAVKSMELVKTLLFRKGILKGDHLKLKRTWPEIAHRLNSGHIGKGALFKELQALITLKGFDSQYSDAKLKVAMENALKDKKNKKDWQKRAAPLANYIWQQIENANERTTLFVSLRRSTCSTEHIIPQKGKSELVYRLGNIMLLEQPINSSCKAEEFSEKRVKYLSSKLSQVQRVTKFATFGEDQINQREQEVLDNLDIIAPPFVNLGKRTSVVRKEISLL